MLLTTVYTMSRVYYAFFAPCERRTCLPVYMIQLENRWTDLDEIWYESYAIGSTLKSFF
jgi:hypothetical protein